MRILKVIGWAFAGEAAASLFVLLVAGCIFGFQFTESVGRFVGVIGTIAGVSGSVVGLLMALRAERGSSPRNTTTLIATIGVVLVTLLTGGNASADERIVTPAMAGHWEGSARIIVTWCQQTNLPVAVDIRADGSVTGKIGDATLTNGSLKRNRGWLGRKLNVKTDYIITGSLSGPIVAAESITRSSVKVPVNFRGGTFVGGVHTSGSKVGGKDRMILSAASLKLTLTRSP